MAKAQEIPEWLMIEHRRFATDEVVDLLVDTPRGEYAIAAGMLGAAYSVYDKVQAQNNSNVGPQSPGIEVVADSKTLIRTSPKSFGVLGMPHGVYGIEFVAEGLGDEDSAYQADQNAAGRLHLYRRLSPTGDTPVEDIVTLLGRRSGSDVELLEADIADRMISPKNIARIAGSLLARQATGGHIGELRAEEDYVLRQQQG